MCRIAGIINNQIHRSEARALVDSMCTCLKHGGPDDQGIFESSSFNVVLGHRRLSIIDMSNGGHQPMQFSQGRYTISFNGEIYNYLHLKKRLEKEGVVFTTKSDTEVILAAYSMWGTDGFKQLDGMFAFAIWDETLGELILARDVSGIKPLYFARTQEGLAFASEVKALAQIPYLNEPNPQWPVFFMAYGHLPEPVTTLKKVQPLEKGHCLIFRLQDSSLKKQCFASHRLVERIVDRTTAIELVREGMNKAVENHLIADAPIGVFLSGGLDSSVVAAIADRYKANLRAVSIYFENAQYSEKKYQDDLQSRFSFTHKQFLVNEGDFHAHLPEIMDVMDLPCCDGINSWFISKYARESGLKAVLSGVGGDELFGGYPSFKRINTVLALEKLPNKLLIKGQLSDIPKFKRLAFLTLKSAVGRYLFLRGQFVPSEIAKFLQSYEKDIFDVLSTAPILPDINYLSGSNQASWMETNLYMQNQLLRDADVMSMAHGLELRVPFLDSELVRTVFSIHSAVKYSGTYPKQLLIDAFRSELPESIWQRPKMGFSFPFKEWFSSDRYKHVLNVKGTEAFHKKMSQGEIHWSKFFTLMVYSHLSKNG